MRRHCFRMQACVNDLLLHFTTSGYENSVAVKAAFRVAFTLALRIPHQRHCLYDEETINHDTSHKRFYECTRICTNTRSFALPER